MGDRIDVVFLFKDPRFRIAFSLSTLCGLMAGIFFEGKSLLGEQDMKIVSSVVLLGGLSGTFIKGRSWKAKFILVLFCTTYVALLGQLTACYLHIREFVFLPELSVPCVLAVFPFAWAYKCFGTEDLINVSRK